MAVGYSGTPPAKKLGIKPASTLALLDAPAGWHVPELPADVQIKGGRASAAALRDADVIVAFCRSSADVAKLVSLGGDVPARSALWIAWPRKAAGHVSDVTDNLVRELLLPTGLVDVKVAALDADWSGLKFVWRKENRPDSARS